jgi:hypothetical protein
MAAIDACILSISRGSRSSLGTLFALMLLGLAVPPAATAGAADLIVVNARIYTADPDHRITEALASRDGLIVYVGDEAGAQALRGSATRTIDAGGRLILPGLVDAHIHPLGLVDIEGCDLGNRAVTLAELSVFARDCIRRFHVPDGEWLTVEDWNFSAGNSPDPEYPTIRAALDRASTTHPIQLRGNDGHHGGFNSLALARAADARGATVGYTKESLASTFARHRLLVGVDGRGEPNGTVDDSARAPLGLPASARFTQLMADPGRVVRALTSRGILLVQDAAARSDNFTLYETLAARGELTVRVNAAQYLAPEDFRNGSGALDVARAVRLASERRDRYATSPDIRAEAVKIFVDGVLEGDPNANPPSLPNAARTRPYLQPRFIRGADGALSVAGYVDTDSAACRRVARAPGRYNEPGIAQAFERDNGFAARQCTKSYGVLTLPRRDLLQWTAGFHEAGFTLHFHAIGDGAVRAALDAIEFARRRDGVATQPDTIAHAQLIDPADVKRLGNDHVFVAYTFAWMYTDPEYDLTVIPFIDRVTGAGAAALHAGGFYYERNAYAARTVKRAGATLIAGSDAPVDTRDPRPFVNMERALTRRIANQPPLQPGESLALTDVLDAYTIDGARALGRADQTGSIEVGKSTDFVILDQDVLRLADAGKPDRISQTAVVETWFRGRLVYQRNQDTSHD